MKNLDIWKTLCLISILTFTSICSKIVNQRFLLISGNGLGDPCDGDFDGDKIPDYEDACSINHHVTHTDFTNLIKIDLSPTERQSRPPIWAVDGTVRRCLILMEN